MVVFPPTTENGAAAPRDVRSTRGRHRFLFGVMAFAIVLSGSLGYCFASVSLPIPSLPWWIGPSFWCAVIVAALSPSIYRVFSTKQLFLETVWSALSNRKVTKTFLIVIGLSVAAIGVFVAVYFPGAVQLPGLTWWHGVAFWGLVIAAITTPRIYLSLPKTGWQTGVTAKQIAAQGAGSMSWLLLIGALFLVNATLIRNPESQDAFVTDALRLLDTRFFTLWHCFFFLLGVGGFLLRYLIQTRLIVADLAQKPSDNLFFGYHLATICGSTFTAAFLISKFSLASSVVGLPFQPNFPVQYWSIIWIALTAEIIFFIGLKHRVFDDLTKHFSKGSSFSLPYSPLLVGSVVVALTLLVVVGGVVAWNTVKFSELPWWTAPAFWSLVIAVALSPKLLQAIPQPSAAKILGGKNNSSPRIGFNRWTIVYAVLLFSCFGIIGTIGYVFASGKVRFADLPSWTMLVFWLTIIVGGITYRVVESVRSFLRESPVRPQSQRKAPPVGHSATFNATKSSRGARMFEFGSTLWIGLAAVVGVLVLGYFGYSILSVQRLDADGHPIAMSWWVGPLFLLLVFAAAAAYPLFKALRENFSFTPRPTMRPTVAPKAAKPVGFNTAVKQKTVRKTSGGSWQLPSLPRIEGVSELLPMAGIGAVTLIGLLIVGYIGYSLSTMERIDADGHPMPMPSWIVPLLLILVVLGAVGYKVVLMLRENSDGVFRSSTVRSTASKAGKPVGFNAAGFGKKKAGFNQPQGGDDWYANPFVWLGILGGVVGVLFLVIIFMLVF